jgi:hypothetical protein
MANELYNCAVFVKGLMDELKPVVEKTHLGPPSSVLTGCEVAVIAETLRHRQLGTYTHSQRHYLILRGYAPMAPEPEIAEAKLLKLWNLMVDILNVNVDLGGTATRSNLERGRMGYKSPAGTKCRTLDGRLEVQLAQAVAYQASED